MGMEVLMFDHQDKVHVTYKCFDKITCISDQFFCLLDFLNYPNFLIRQVNIFVPLEQPIEEQFPRIRNVALQTTSFASSIIYLSVQQEKHQRMNVCFLHTNFTFEKMRACTPKEIE